MQRARAGAPVLGAAVPVGGFALSVGSSGRGVRSASVHGSGYDPRAHPLHPTGVSGATESETRLTGTARRQSTAVQSAHSAFVHSARFEHCGFRPKIWVLFGPTKYTFAVSQFAFLSRGAKRVVLGTFQRLRNGKSCGIPGSGMILAIESYQRC